MIKVKIHEDEPVRVKTAGTILQGPPGPRGDKGDPGEPGKDGKDGRDGIDGRDGRDGRDGTDYIITEADYAEIAALVPRYDDTELRGEVDALRENKADKTALDETNRDVEFLKLVTKDVNWTKEEREENGHATLPKGGMFGNVDEVRGKTGQESTNGYQLIDLSRAYASSSNITFMVENGNITATSMASYHSVKIPIDIEPLIGKTIINYRQGLTTDNTASNSGSRLRATDSVARYITNGSTYTVTEETTELFYEIVPVNYPTPPSTPTTVTIIEPMVELGSTVHPWEKYTGGVPMPNPDYPSEIVSVDEIRIEKTGANLFDESAVSLNTWIEDAAGNTGSVSGYNVSDFIPVESGKTYHFKATGSARNVVYDADKKSISSGWAFSSTMTSWTAPANCKYIRLTITNPNLNEFYFGTDISEYEPYRSEQRTIIPPKPLNTVGSNVYRDTCDIVEGLWKYWTVNRTIKLANFNPERQYPTSTDLYGSFVDADTFRGIGDASNRTTLRNGSIGIVCEKLKTFTADSGHPDIYNGERPFEIGLTNGSNFIRITLPHGYDASTLGNLPVTYITNAEKTEPIDPADLDYLRALTLNKGENLYITDNHGRDVSYLMSDFINLKEALA